MRKQNDLFDHNAALEMANCRVSKSHKECGVRSIPLFLLFCCLFVFFHAEIGQFGHFCFPQINQNSFCPLNSSQLLLKEANLAFSWRLSKSLSDDALRKDLLCCGTSDSSTFRLQISFLSWKFQFKLFFVYKWICFLHQKGRNHTIIFIPKLFV